MSLLLLDSASLYYRAFYALPESLTAPDGRPINAVRGFLDTVTTLVVARGIRRAVACWDEDWRPAWRVQLVPGYKAHRVAIDRVAMDRVAGTDAGIDRDTPDPENVPDTLAPQVDMLRQLLPLVGVPIVGLPSAEADDVIADLSCQAPRVDIASGDRDLVQLVNDHVTMLFTGGTSASRGGRPWVEWDPEAVEERFGIPPTRYADLAILRGDPSDGLPGAPGIGDKTALALIRAFGDLSGVLHAAQDPATSTPMTPAVRRRVLSASTELERADRVVRLVPHPDRVALPAPVVVDPDHALTIANQWGVQASTQRLLSALSRSG